MTASVYTSREELTNRLIHGLGIAAGIVAVPWLAWTFHPNCPPNLLQATESGCGEGMDLVPTEWGELIEESL
mgnify:CR=1 FL=1